MLAFLIGTSILNIFVGYALAVYLMRESLTPSNHQSSGNLLKSGGAAPIDARRESSELYPSNGAAAPSSTPSSSSNRPAESVDGKAASPRGNSNEQPASSMVFSSIDAPNAEDTIDRGPEEMDQQLLAGIADFRSQLAKLRAETGEEPKRRQVAKTNK